MPMPHDQLMCQSRHNRLFGDLARMRIALVNMTTCSVITPEAQAAAAQLLSGVDKLHKLAHKRVNANGTVSDVVFTSEKERRELERGLSA